MKKLTEEEKQRIIDKRVGNLILKLLKSYDKHKNTTTLALDCFQAGLHEAQLIYKGKVF